MHNVCKLYKRNKISAGGAILMGCKIIHAYVITTRYYVTQYDAF